MWFPEANIHETMFSTHSILIAIHMPFMQDTRNMYKSIHPPCAPTLLLDGRHRPLETAGWKVLEPVRQIWTCYEEVHQTIRKKTSHLYIIYREAMSFHVDDQAVEVIQILPNKRTNRTMRIRTTGEVVSQVLMEVLKFLAFSIHYQKDPAITGV